MKIKSSIAYLACALLFQTITGCGQARETASVEGMAVASVLRRGNGDDPATLDPALAEDVHAFNVLIDIYEGLLAEAADGSLIPGVAETWEVSDNGQTYRFRLRPDARWSNGDSVLAADFVKAFRRVAVPDSQSSYGFLLEPIENFASVRNGSMPAEALGIRAVDDRTLEIRLSSPSPHILAVLAMPVAFPVHGDKPTQSQFSDPAEFVGNGAYVLASRQVGRPIRLLRNRHYWDKQSVAVDEIQYLPVINPASELNMYRTGELDITGTVPPGAFKSLKQDLPQELRVAPALALYYLAFDLSERPLNGRKLRQALSMAIDREQLAELLGRGERPAYNVVPPGVGNHVAAGYDWRNLSSNDREQRARKLYNDAGYNSENPLSITLTYDAGDIHEFVALAVSSMWADVLGANIELEKKEWKLFLATRSDRPSWQMMRFSWFGDYNDARTFTDIFRSDSVQNLPGFTSMRYDALLNEAAMETRLEKRRDLMTEAEQLLIDDYPIAPLYFFVSKHMVKSHVVGFKDNVLDRHPSKYLSILEIPPGP